MGGGRRARARARARAGARAGGSGARGGGAEGVRTARAAERGEQEQGQGRERRREAGNTPHSRRRPPLHHRQPSLRHPGAQREHRETVQLFGEPPLPLYYCELASHYDVTQIRNYETKYLCSELPLESGLGFTILTMETLQTRCGEAKVRNCFCFNETFTRKVESSL